MLIVILLTHLADLLRSCRKSSGIINQAYVMRPFYTMIGAPTLPPVPLYYLGEKKERVAAVPKRQVEETRRG